MTGAAVLAGAGHVCSREPCPGVVMETRGERYVACPATAYRAVWSTMHAYATLSRHGILPVAGGMLDQAESFLQAVAVLDSRMGEIEHAS